MIPCLLVGNAVAYKLAAAMPACAVDAHRNATATSFLAQDIAQLRPAGLTVISLAPDVKDPVDYGEELKRLRGLIVSRQVVWLVLPGPTEQAVREIASLHQDGIVELPAALVAGVGSPETFLRIAAETRRPAELPPRLAAARPPSPVRGTADPLAVCAPSVSPITLRAIINVESGDRPFAIHVNDVQQQPASASTAEQANAIAEAWIAKGYSVDLGLMQVNSGNLHALGYRVSAMFDPCTNVRAGAMILTADYLQAHSSRPDPQKALQAALSAYNTGNFYQGFSNGYVAKYYGPGAAGASSMPLIQVALSKAAEPAPPPNPYTASPLIEFGKATLND